MKNSRIDQIIGKKILFIFIGFKDKTIENYDTKFKRCCY